MCLWIVRISRAICESPLHSRRVAVGVYVFLRARNARPYGFVRLHIVGVALAAVRLRVVGDTAARNFIGFRFRNR